MSKTSPRILIVEDELLIAMDVTQMVERCGCGVIGPVGTIGAALTAIEGTELDGAILDINLGKTRVWPVADALQDRNVPFILASGYDRTEVPERFGARPIVAKPMDFVLLREALTKIGIDPRR